MFSISESMSALSYDFIYLVSFDCSSLSYFLTFIFFLGTLLLQSAKGAKAHNVAAAAASSEGPPVTEGEEKIKMHTHSYCCLDYAQVSFQNLCH